MALSSLTQKNTYNGNDLTTEWSYTFPILTSDGSDIAVYITDSDGDSTLITSGYTVDVDGAKVVYPAVTVPLTDPLAAGSQITLLRIQPLTQELDLITGGSFNAEVIESAFDKVTMICQQLKEEIGRCLKIGVSYDTDAAETALAYGYAEAAQTAQGLAEDAEDAAVIAQAAAEAAETAAEAAVAALTVVVATKVIAPATNTANYIPQWNGLNSKLLKNGLEKSTDGTMADNSDLAVPTEKAVKTYITTVGDSKISKTTVGELNAMTIKASPVASDVLLIEDSAASYAKKKILKSTLGFINAGQYYAPDNACVLALAGYNFDPGAATTFKDSSLYGNDFTIASTPPEGVGKISKVCVDLDGVADTLSIADGSYAEFGDCDDIAIECWIKHDVAGAEHFIWQNGSAIGNLSISTANKFVVVLNVGTGAATITSGSAYASITAWYHIVVTYQATDHVLRLFVDGVADGTDATKSGDVDAASGDIFYIGSNGGASEWFNGKIDGFRILRRDMLVAEALARYNAFK